MKSSFPLPILVARSLLAIAVTALFTAGLFVLRTLLSTPVIGLLYLLPVILCAARWGLGAGVAAALAAFLAFDYVFIPPYYLLTVRHTQDLLVLIVFLAIAIFTSQLVGRAQAERAAATLRQHETQWLYELSVALAGLHDDGSGVAIAHTLAHLCQAVFRASAVQINLEAAGERTPCAIRLPAEGPFPETRPLWITPLETAHGLLGEICLWRESALSEGEERLLRAFASQGVLALERAYLSVAERRAGVLEESDRLKTALLSSVSHELRTPLATIKAAISSLRSAEVDWDKEARQDLLAAIEEETDYLNQLVGNLLNMSRIEAGALRPQRSWNLLAEIIGRALGRSKAAAQQHQVVLDLPEDLPLIPVDFSLMEQVFVNLISNSLKYSPPGTAIRIAAHPNAHQALQVTVSNQGPPVPEEHLERIFDKFYRITAADRVTGTGLGLSICKGIIEAHGGHIWASNQSDGFAFHFTLPLTAADLAPIQPVSEEMA